MDFTRKILAVLVCVMVMMQGVSVIAAPPAAPAAAAAAAPATTGLVKAIAAGWEASKIAIGVSGATLGWMVAGVLVAGILLWGYLATNDEQVGGTVDLETYIDNGSYKLVQIAGQPGQNYYGIWVSQPFEFDADEFGMNNPQSMADPDSHVTVTLGGDELFKIYLTNYGGYGWDLDLGLFKENWQTWRLDARPKFPYNNTLKKPGYPNDTQFPSSDAEWDNGNNMANRAFIISPQLIVIAGDTHAEHGSEEDAQMDGFLVVMETKLFNFIRNKNLKGEKVTAQELANIAKNIEASKNPAFAGAREVKIKVWPQGTDPDNIEIEWGASPTISTARGAMTAVTYGPPAPGPAGVAYNLTQQDKEQFEKCTIIENGTCTVKLMSGVYYRFGYDHDGVAGTQFNKGYYPAENLDKGFYLPPVKPGQQEVAVDVGPIVSENTSASGKLRLQGFKTGIDRINAKLRDKYKSQLASGKVKEISFDEMITNKYLKITRISDARIMDYGPAGADGIILDGVKVGDGFKFEIRVPKLTPIKGKILNVEKGDLE